MADRVADGHAPAAGLPFLRPGDLETMAAPTDFLGVNYYSRAVVRSDRIPEAENAPRTVPVPNPEQVTDMGWEAYPDGLRALLLELARDYPVGELAVTENGAAFATGPDPDGRVRDARRRAFLESHLGACQQAMAAGAPLRAYFAWSLLDNFEWACGYEKRFRLCWVDFETRARLPKDSALCYRDQIRRRQGVASGGSADPSGA